MALLEQHTRLRRLGPLEEEQVELSSLLGRGSYGRVYRGARPLLVLNARSATLAPKRSLGCQQWAVLKCHGAITTYSNDASAGVHAFVCI